MGIVDTAAVLRVIRFVGTGMAGADEVDSSSTGFARLGRAERTGSCATGTVGREEGGSEVELLPNTSREEETATSFSAGRRSAEEVKAGKAAGGG